MITDKFEMACQLLHIRIGDEITLIDPRCKEIIKGTIAKRFRANFERKPKDITRYFDCKPGDKCFEKLQKPTITDWISIEITKNHHYCFPVTPNYFKVIEGMKLCQKSPILRSQFRKTANGLK